MNDRLRGHVDVLLLSALDVGPAHGYGLAELLRERSGGKFDLPEGTIYPSLYRLERKNFVSSSWKTVDGRRRRVYSLTRSGTRELERQRADWQSFSSAMEAVVT